MPLVATSIFWMPSRYIGTAANQVVKDNYPGGVSDVLAQQVDCDKLGGILEGYEGCDAACVTKLCSDGLKERWSIALNASAAAQKVGEIAIEASGEATFADDATLTGFEGQWLGSISNGDILASSASKAFRPMRRSLRSTTTFKSSSLLAAIPYRVRREQFMCAATSAMLRSAMPSSDM